VAVLRSALVAIGFTLCVACQREPTQIELHDARIIVHSLLRAGEDSVRVFVARVDTRGTSATESPLVAVANARVRITHGADTVVLSTRSHCVSGNGFPANSSDLDKGCYAGAIAGGVRSGERYQLFVDSDGGSARGEAVVPALPVLHSPAPGITLQYSRTHKPELATSALVRWSGTEPGRRIELSFRTARRECNAAIAPPNLEFGDAQIVRLAGDTATIAAFDVFCPADDSQSVFPTELLLTAFDAAYTKYLTPRSSTTVRPEDAAVGLTEGLGVFAASASVAVPITLVRR
jgi:hypothetical protein